MSIHTLPQPLTKGDVPLFKQVFLPIILLKEVVNVFKKKRKTAPLKRNIEAYNDELRQTEQIVYDTGAATSINDLLRIESKQALIDVYNKTFDDSKPQELIDAAGAALPKFGNHYQTVSHFIFCQHFLKAKLPAYYSFTIGFTDEAGEDYSSINAFVASNQKLKDCWVRSDDGWSIKEKVGPKLSTPLETLIDGQAGESQENQPPSDKEYCVAYFLNEKYIVDEARLTLTWTSDRKRLLHVLMTQGVQGNFITYESLDETIFQAVDSPVFMTLRAQRTHRSAYFQIAVQPDVYEKQRMGSFSAISQRILSSTSTELISLGGKFILLTLAKENDSVNDNTTAQIRYRLRNQLLIETPAIRRKHEQTQGRWQSFVGKYVCTYIRLAYADDPRLQTSFIELFADGRSTLTQFNSHPAEGWGRFTFGSEGPDKIWLFFGQNDELGQTRVRFLLKVPTKGTTLKGIFTSETLKSERIVSGRMLMKKLGASEPWPENHLNVPYHQVLYTHIGTDEDLAFFTGQQTDTLQEDGSKTMSDGPYWASIANRLSFPSALKELNKFYKEPAETTQVLPKEPADAVEPTSPHTPFSDGCFYYYVFKEHDDRDVFLIERNFVLFNQDGTVTIIAGENHYVGQAYYDNRTLKISLSHSKNGFLDAYFDLSFTESDDTSTIRVLYGASLWRSKNRIEAKAVVLSRLGKQPLDQTTKIFKFLNPDDPNYAAQMQQLTDEDSPAAGAGVVTYMRGTLNRFHHSSVHAPSGGFRPRDAQSREPHFLVASYYALTLRGLNQTKSLGGTEGDQTGKLIRSREKQLGKQVRNAISEIKRHLRIAHVYGYACSFGNLKIDLETIVAEISSNTVNHNLLSIQQLVEQQYDQHFTNAELSGRKKPEILKRLLDIANEQMTVRAAFVEGGLFYHIDYPELRKLGNQLWPDIVPAIAGLLDSKRTDS